MKIEIEDKVTLGVVAGIISNILRNIVGFITYFLGVKAHHIWHFAASAYLEKNVAKTFPGILVGMVTDYIIASLIGVFSVYFLLHVGFKNIIVKGFVIGGLAWLFIFTLVVRFKISRVDPNSVSGSISFLFNHLLLGILIALIIKKYGEKNSAKMKFL